MNQQSWDAQAEHFDEEADHGLSDPRVRAAWRDLLRAALPTPPALIADLGCGTGTISRLLTEQGYAVDGVDFSPKMIERARAKTPEARFIVADAAEPPLAPAAYDVVLCRHVLWALPDPAAALTAWRALLAPEGMLVLIEGHWGTGAGLSVTAMQRLLKGAVCEAQFTLLNDPAYWGKPITDERYLALARP